jgi:hypothetical protein
MFIERTGSLEILLAPEERNLPCSPTNHRKHCAPLERESYRYFDVYKHLAPLEPGFGGQGRAVFIRG